MTKKENKKTVTEELDELESIVRWFEAQEKLEIEKSLDKAKQGAELVKSLKTRLKSVENEFEEIVKSLEKSA